MAQNSHAMFSSLLGVAMRLGVFWTLYRPSAATHELWQPPSMMGFHFPASPCPILAPWPFKEEVKTFS